MSIIQQQQNSSSEIITAKEKRAMKRKSLIEKGQAISGMVKGSSNEPLISPLSYKIDLIRALNYYNSAYDSKDKAKWVINSLSTDKAKQKILGKLPDYEFNSIGSLVRLKSRNQFLDNKELQKIDNELQRLVDLGLSIIDNDNTQQNKPLLDIKKPVRIDRQQDEALRLAGEFEGLIDEFISNDVIPDFSSYLKSNNVTQGVASKIPSMFQSNLLELEEVFNNPDNDQKDGYSNFTRTKLRKLLAIYKSIEESCKIQKVVVKTQSKPKKRKEQPVSKIIAKVKYQKEDTSLNIKSELPTKLVGATEVWLYNTRYKKLQVYKVAEPSKMTVKGTTLIGWDPSISMCKTIRKTDLLSSYQTMNKYNLIKSFKDLKTKESTVTGRLNDQTIILKIFQ